MTIGGLEMKVSQAIEQGNKEFYNVIRRWDIVKKFDRQLLHTVKGHLVQGTKPCFRTMKNPVCHCRDKEVPNGLHWRSC
jgi:hypothetical protein